MKQVIIKKDSAPLEIIQRIMALPPVEEKGFLPVDPRSTLLCLQAEYGILDSKLQGEYPIKYIGTKELYDCLFVVIKNESNEYFFIHIDSSMMGNYLAGIQEFKKPSSRLEVMLIGGTPPPAKNDPLYKEILSDGILFFIVTELIQLANSHTITVVGQRLLQHNYQAPPKYNRIDEMLTVRNKKQIYQRLCEAVQILYLYLHGHYFNSAFIDIRFPTPDSLDREIKCDRVKAKQIAAFVMAISDVCGKMPVITVAQIDKNCPEIKLDKTKHKAQVNFYQRVSDTMSIEGAKILNIAGFGNTGNILTDFVIELETGQVFSIPRHTKTYNETLRDARRDSFGDINQQSFLFFSGQRYQPIPQTSTKFEQQYAQVAKLIQESKYTSSTGDAKDDRVVSTMYLNLFHFRKKWGNQVPSLRAYNVALLCDSLEAIFATNRVGLKKSQISLISDYATGPSL